MKRIKLTQNKFALVDDDIFDKLNIFKWYANKLGNNYYAVRNLTVAKGKQERIYMHRIIACTPGTKDTDHIDGNGLNNQRKNLRICNRSENLINRGKMKNNTSGFKGVSWHNIGKKWLASIHINGKQKSIGLFETKLGAHKAYCKASEKYHKEFSRII